MVMRVVLALCLSLCVGLSTASAAEPIGYLFKDKIEKKVPVNVYLKEIVNQSGNNKILPESFKKSLDESFHKRRSIKFDIVSNQAESDIQVVITIKNFQYMNRGPFKPNLGIETTLLDAAATATMNYVEMEVEYTVIDTNTGKTLWQGTVDEYLKKKMTLEESIPLIYDVMTRTFIWKCFGKANLR